MALAIQIMGNGTIYQFDKDWNLDELKEAIGGGWVQAVALRDGGVMWLDEEGKIKGLPVNPVATQVALRAAAIFADDTINGVALITGLESDDGVFADLPDKVLFAAFTAAKEVGGS